MSQFEALMKAKTLLGLRDRATLQEIKLQYKSLMQQWHPDKHRNDPDTATQMSTQINSAYELILNYCNRFEYPLDEESLKKATQTPHEWWRERFGPK